MPNSFAETDEGILLIADGFGSVLSWDGFAPTAKKAGVPKPTAAPVLSASLIGPLVGTYRCFLRFVDDLGNTSSVSPVSDEVDIFTATAPITGATSVTPITVESKAHGLATGVVVKVQEVGGQTGANGVFPITVVDSDHFILEGSYTSGNYTGGGEWLSGAGLITYSNVGVTADPRVRRRQVLRNTDGQQTTFYVDVDTADLSSPTLTSTLTDDQLQGNEAFPVFDSHGRSLLNVHDEPPNTKPYILFHQGRMFYAGDVEYTEGAVGVTFGSALVQGVATEWTTAAAGRFLYVVNADRPYEVLGIDVATQVLTLVEPYTAPTNPYALYGLRVSPAEERAVYISGADTAEGVNPLDAFAIPVDGDKQTGLLSKNSFLFILERRHVYKFTFQNDPVEDGGLFMVATRGCVNHRCCVIAEDVAYMLDEDGVHTFDSPDQDKSISTPIQSLFRPDLPGPKINWSASRYFHGVHDQTTETIRWYIALTGQYLPRHALCYHYTLDRWELEELPFPIGSSFVGRFHRTSPLTTWGSGRPQVFLGAVAHRVLALGESPLDGPAPEAGATAGRVVAASTRSLTAAVAPEPALAAQMVGLPLVVTRGRGQGQLRIVASIAGAEYDLTQPWRILPDVTSAFQLGGIPWVWKSGWLRWVEEEAGYVRRIELMMEPTVSDQRLIVRRYRDRNDIPIRTGVQRAEDGVYAQADSGDVVIRLDEAPGGFAQVRMDAGRDAYVKAQRLLSVGLFGVGGEERQLIYALTIDGVRATGGGSGDRGEGG